MTIDTETRRLIMLNAWDAKRAEPSRSFADCLRGAWKCFKRGAAYAKKAFKTLRETGSQHFQMGSLVRRDRKMFTREAYARARMGF